MIARLKGILARAKQVAQTEGVRPLLRRAFDLYVFSRGRYWLYEHSLVGRDEGRFAPRVEDVTVQLVHSNAEADELAMKTGQDFRLRAMNARRGLDHGAVFFCFFVKGELAHIGWVAMSEEARQALGVIPQRVDFDGGVAYTGGSETVPEYRRKGLMAYGYFKRFEYLRERGMRASRNAVSFDNVASHKVHGKFGPRVYARARHVRLLGLEFWKETLISESEGPA